MCSLNEQERLAGKSKKSKSTIKEKEGWQWQEELEGPELEVPDYKNKKGWLARARRAKLQ
jgi:hypothetical protein